MFCMFEDSEMCWYKHNAAFVASGKYGKYEFTT